MIKEKLAIWLKRMLLAFQMMSRIPINMALPCEREDMLGSMIFFPAVGGVIGGLMALAALVGEAALRSHAAAAFLAVLCEIMTTGGIHLDGLGDTCDGIFSGRERARVLEIMHDSRTGTFGALGLIAVILGKFAFCCAILEHMGVGALGYIAVTPVLSRMGIVLLEKIGRSARSGMGSAYVDGMSWRHVGAAWVLGAIIALAVRPFALIGAPLAGVICVLANRYFEHRLGGLTGDTLGAVNELSALILLGAWAVI